jgi:phosphoserine aminotransferase
MVTVEASMAARHNIRRVFNFNPGPAALPLPVLGRIGEELLDYRGSGMSVMEMSHRSPEYEALHDKTAKDLRRILAIPDDYAVVFLQGGGSGQFAMVPMNLYLPGQAVDVLHTGSWTSKAIEELSRLATYRIACSTEPEKFTRISRKAEIALAPNASYVHMCTNNTIEGTQWSEIPDTGAIPLVADMSSDIASRQMDVRQFGLIFAGAQKNLGPSGVTIVILRRDLAERASDRTAKVLQYKTHIEEKSLYHTPPTFAVYVVGLMLEWIEAVGGVAAIEKRNDAKANLLYHTIDASQYYRCPVEKDSRSKMNAIFRVAGGDETIESKFAKEAQSAGLVGVKGHRLVGGMRISLYNAVSMEAVETLVGFMREFERKNG